MSRMFVEITVAVAFSRFNKPIKHPLIWGFCGEIKMTHLKHTERTSWLA